MMFRIVAAIGVMLVSIPLKAQEFHGTFAPDSLALSTIGDEEGLFRVTSPYSYTDPNGFIWSVPEGAETNGASIPKYLWSVVGSPFTGRYLAAAVVHDYYCETRERTAHATHRAFYNAMLAKGVSKWRAKLMYAAVVAFGPSWELKNQRANQQSLSQGATQQSATTSRPSPQRARIDIAPVKEEVFEDESDGISPKQRLVELAEVLEMTEGESVVCQDCFQPTIAASVAAPTVSSVTLATDIMVASSPIEFDVSALEREDWKTIQSRLKDLGYDAGPIDGLPGPKTRAGIRALQSARGDATTGDLDPALASELLTQPEEMVLEQASIEVAEPDPILIDASLDNLEALAMDLRRGVE